MSLRNSFEAGQRKKLKEPSTMSGRSFLEQQLNSLRQEQLVLTCIFHDAEILSRKRFLNTPRWYDHSSLVIRDGPNRASMDRTISSSGSAVPGGQNRGSFDSNWDVIGEEHSMSAMQTGDSSGVYNAIARSAAAAAGGIFFALHYQCNSIMCI